MDIISKLHATLEKEGSVSENSQSLITFIAQLPSNLVTDLEIAAKIVNNLLTIHLKNDDIQSYIILYTELLTSNLDNQFILLHNNEKGPYKLFVRDKFIVQVILLLSIKYNRELFKQNDVRDVTKSFLQSIIEFILRSIDINKQQSLYLIRLLDTLLRKRDDLVAAPFAVKILISMNKVARSPLNGSKRWAQNVSGIVIQSLTEKQKKVICHLNYLPNNSINLFDVFGLFKGSELKNNCNEINRIVLNLFRFNVDSREGSFFYQSLIKVLSFDEFVRILWPKYYPFLQTFEAEGEFYNSLIKYWIPQSVKRYETDFYSYVRNKNVHIILKAFILFETRKQGFYKIEFDYDLFKLIKHPLSADIGLKIVSTYVKKSLCPSENELNLFKYYIHCYPEDFFTDDIVKGLRQFISQIFLVCHIIISKKSNKDFSIYITFIKDLVKFCQLRLNIECCELSAVLLKLLWDLGTGPSSNLLTAYKIDKENMYESENNLFYLKLLNGLWLYIFQNDQFILDLQTFLSKESKYCPVLIELVIERYLNKVNIHFLGNFQSLLLRNCNTINMQNLDIYSIYCNLLASYGDNFSNDVISLTEIFKNNIASLEIEQIYGCVLILNAFLALKIRTKLDTADELNLIKLLENTFAIFECIFEDDISGCSDTRLVKAWEALINNSLDCLIALKDKWHNLNKNQLLRQLCQIIKRSNMKKPISKTVNVVHHLGAIMEDFEDDKKIKIHLLSDTLNSLCYPQKKYGKIRRNPETRLVIHALSLSDTNSEKPYLHWSLNFLLGILSDSENIPESSVASALHCLEVLVSEKSVHQDTLVYVPRIIGHCINLFNNKNWIIRNGNLQLLKALIERFLGVSLDYCLRYKSIEDILILFPEISKEFLKTISKTELDDSAIVVLLFFSESQLKQNILIDPNLKRILTNFRSIFEFIIKNYANHLGFLAIRSYTSLCTEDEIPQIITEIANCIKINYHQLDSNIFANLIQLIQELVNKYECGYYKNSFLIQSSMENLHGFLKQFNCFYYNLLSLKIIFMVDFYRVFANIMAQEIDYQARIWLNNYVPFAILTCEIAELNYLLGELLFSKIPDFLHELVLSSLINRFEKQEHGVSSEIINVLISKLTQLPDSNKYLITHYSKAIFVFHKSINHFVIGEDVIAGMRRDLKTDNIRKIFVYILVESYIFDQTNSDLIFLNSSVNSYMQHLGDDEIILDLALTLTFLYRASPECNRVKIFKICFHLLLKYSTCFEMCKFIGMLTQSDCNSILISLRNFLSPSNLLNCLGDKKTAVKLLLEFLIYIDHLPEDFGSSDTFYLIESDVSIHKSYVRKLIIVSLENCR